MHAERNVRVFIQKLLAVLNLYSVPLAAAVLGWIFAGRMTLWTLEFVVADAGSHGMFAASAFLMYSAQSLAALLLFLIASRYLN